MDTDQARSFGWLKSLGIFLVGLIIGLVVLGWWLWPVEWVNASPEQLTAAWHQEYLRMAIDSYTVNQDAGLAQMRYDALGAYAQSTLNSVAQNPGTVPPAEIASYANVVQPGGVAAVSGATAPVTAPARNVAPVVILAALFLLLLVFAVLVLLKRNLPGRRSMLPGLQTLAGFLILGLFVCVTLAAPYLTAENDPQDPTGYRRVGKSNQTAPLPPGPGIPLGAVPDSNIAGQYDIWYSLVWGTRTAFLFSIGVVAVTCSVGVLIGATSGYFGGWLNNLSMGFTDAFLTVPLIAGVVFFRELIYLAMQSSGMRVFMNNMYDFPAGPPTAWQTFLVRLDPVFLAFILLSWMPYARLMNSAVLSAHRAEYIQAVHALGAGHGRIIMHHLIPNTIAPVLVLAARDVGFVVLIQASFTFIGLGSHSEWGQMLSLGRNWVVGPGGNPLVYWWTFVPASLALVLFGIAWNLLGDSLNNRINRYRA